VIYSKIANPHKENLTEYDKGLEFADVSPLDIAEVE